MTQGESVTDAAIAAPLLAHLRQSFARPSLRYRDVPTSIAGGSETFTYGFSLAVADGPLARPLVLRLFDRHDDPSRARFEAAVQNAVNDLGYPAPRVLLAVAAREPLGGAFLVMERRLGRPLFDTLDTESSLVLRSLRTLPHLVRHMPVLLASLQLRLHALDQSRVVELVRAAGLVGPLPTVDVRLGELRRRVDAAGFVGLAPGIAWLLEHQPPRRDREVLCHGDIWPANVLAAAGRVTAVLDWSVALVTFADPAYDVGNTLAGLAYGEAGYPRVFRGIARAVQRRIAHRFLATYTACEGLVADDVHYHVLLRCFSNCCWVAERRTGVPGTRLDPAPNVWDLPGSVDGFRGHFRSCTGIRLRLPGD